MLATQQKSDRDFSNLPKNLVWMNEPFLKQNVLFLLFWVVQFKTNAEWAQADWEDHQANSSRVYKGTLCCQLLVYYLTRWFMLLPYDKVPASICTLQWLLLFNFYEAIILITDVYLTCLSAPLLLLLASALPGSVARDSLCSVQQSCT